MAEAPPAFPKGKGIPSHIVQLTMCLLFCKQPRAVGSRLRPGCITFRNVAGYFQHFVPLRPSPHLRLRSGAPSVTRAYRRRAPRSDRHTVQGRSDVPPSLARRNPGLYMAPDPKTRQGSRPQLMMAVGPVARPWGLATGGAGQRRRRDRRRIATAPTASRPTEAGSGTEEPGSWAIWASGSHAWRVST